MFSRGRGSRGIVMNGCRLAVLAPISWPTPPPGYGPWEQIAYNIADGMRRRGLDVTLFAPAIRPSRDGWPRSSRPA